MTPFSRRTLLRLVGGATLGLPLFNAFGQNAGRAKRLIIFYFPDGVPAPNGETSRFHPTGSDTTFLLPTVLSPLEPYRQHCTFFNGLSLGPSGAGSHPAGAKKLLTGRDEGQGESVDQYLARKFGAGLPFPHLCLGAMATANNPSSDKFISYSGPGTTVAPEDNPIRAFQRLFGGGGPMTPSPPTVDRRQSVIDLVLGDLNELRGRLGLDDARRLDLHLEAVREVEQRLQTLPPPAMASCQSPAIDTSGVNAANLFDPARFPAVLKAQIEVMVTAMACGLSRVGVLQASAHTSELMMSAFPPLASPNFYMRSHEASHYGQSSDAKFGHFVAQRRWFMSQVAVLAAELAKRPEGQGTMLDTSLVLVCSEVGDGNTHSHDGMPLFLLGKADGAVRAGRLFDFGYRRHSDLLATVARAMGDSLTTWGEGGQGPLPGVLSFS